MEYLFKFFNLYIYKRKKGFGVSYYGKNSESISFIYNFKDKKELNIFLKNYLENNILNNTSAFLNILNLNKVKNNKSNESLNLSTDTQNVLSLEDLLLSFQSDIYSYILYFFEVPEILNITGLTKFSILSMIKSKSDEQVSLKYMSKFKINILNTVDLLCSTNAA